MYILRWLLGREEAQLYVLELLCPPGWVGPGVVPGCLPGQLEIRTLQWLPLLPSPPGSLLPRLLLPRAPPRQFLSERPAERSHSRPCPAAPRWSCRGSRPPPGGNKSNSLSVVLVTNLGVVITGPPGDVEDFQLFIYELQATDNTLANQYFAGPISEY